MATTTPVSRKGQAWTLLTTAILVSAILGDIHSPFATAAAITAATPAPSPLVAVPAPAPAPRKPLTLHEKVVAALRAAGHYGAISGLLDSLGENTVIKEGITFFAPDDGAFDGLNMNSSRLLLTTLDYHVATIVYDYKSLSNLPLNTTIPTAAPNVLIYITSAGTNGLRLDDVAITDADLYNADQVAVHGVSSVLNTAKYNKGVVPPEAAPVAENPALAPGLITTPTASNTTSPAGTGNGGSHIVASVLSSVLLVSAVSLLISI